MPKGRKKNLGGQCVLHCLEARRVPENGLWTACYRGATAAYGGLAFSYSITRLRSRNYDGQAFPISSFAAAGSFAYMPGLAGSATEHTIDLLMQHIV